MTTYTRVRDAALNRDSTDTTRTWALADAILAYVPATGDRSGVGGRGNSAPPEGVSSSLVELAEQLAVDGVLTPNGETYTASSLSHLRDVAMAWPTDKRHANVAYRTHREAGSPTSDGGKVLAQLARHANGEATRKPDGVDPDAWARAKDAVAARTKGFAVTANDVRVAMSRRPNVPGRNSGSVRDAVRELVEQHGAAAVAEVIGVDEDLSTQVRTEAIRNQTGRNIDRDRRPPTSRDPEPRVVRTLQGAMIAMEVAMLADSMVNAAIYMDENDQLDQTIVDEDSGEIVSERVRIRDEALIVIDKMMRTLRVIGMTDAEISSEIARIVTALPSSFTVNDEALVAFLDGTS